MKSKIPGEALRIAIMGQDMSISEFAFAIGTSRGHLINITNGIGSITPAMALRMEKILPIKAEFWIKLENEYQLAFNLRLIKKMREADFAEKATGLGALKKSMRKRI